MTAARALKTEVAAVLTWLEENGTAKTRDGMARYAILSDKAFGVTMAKLNVYARQFRRRHDLALALWDAERYEARMLATLVDDAALVTPAQMDRWCRDFDNWAICDTACFKLFDRSPHAWARARVWCKRRKEFEKRAGFALIASLALHERKAPDEMHIAFLPLIEAGASDDRNFVKKGVSWALRGIGMRTPARKQAALAVAKRLAASADATERWVGKDALRAFAK